MSGRRRSRGQPPSVLASRWLVVVRETELDDLQRTIDDFRHRHRIEKIVAFSGGADSREYDEKHVEAVLAEALDVLKHQDAVAILTGGTAYGVPKYATSLAKANDM